MLPVLANLTWPGLILTARLSAWWCIAASILLEAAALWRFGRMGPVKAITGCTVMNGVSALLGLLLLPLASIRWYTLVDLTYKAWFGWGTFNWITEVATCGIAVLLNTVIELFVLWLVFITPWSRRLTVVVLAANAVTVALAWVSMLVLAVPR